MTDTGVMPTWVLYFQEMPMEVFCRRRQAHNRLNKMLTIDGIDSGWSVAYVVPAVEPKEFEYTDGWYDWIDRGKEGIIKLIRSPNRRKKAL